MIRLGAVIALVWLWLTLLGFTLGVSREVLSLLIGRSVYSPGGLGPLTVPASLIFTTMSVLVVVPGVLAWNELLHLARVLGQLVVTALNWESEEDASDIRILRLQHLVQDAVRVFVRWFQWFALVWVLIIAVAALGAIMGLANALTQQGFSGSTR